MDPGGLPPPYVPDGFASGPSAPGGSDKLPQYDMKMNYAADAGPSSSIGADGEDQLELLGNSMIGDRWSEARAALAGIADIAARYDKNGLDIHFLNSKAVGTGLHSSGEVMQLFDKVRPNGMTPTGDRLEDLLSDYYRKLEKSKGGSGKWKLWKQKEKEAHVKPANFIVVTDGAATDDPAPVIKVAAKRLDEGNYPLSQVGIQFLQIGDDEKAAVSLKQLDDDLDDVRDMVDTVPYTQTTGHLNANMIIKILLGGINRRQDKVPNEAA
ncbi:hypothetical protein FRB99_005415 [Tulasnella sp. 403]|nr:hypothetical protein FRB99_005415 [Tulasnella sp. 403]